MKIRSPEHPVQCKNTLNHVPPSHLSPSLSLQALMGVFFYIHSVALVEDLAVDAHYADPNDFYAAADKAFMQVRQP